MSIFSLVILRGPTKLGFPHICAKAAATQGNVLVEVLLPKCGRGLRLSCSGRSAVLGIDADGGSPDGDFPKEGGIRVAARCPLGLFAAMAGGVSDLTCKVDNELRSLRQVLAPNVMIMKRLRCAGKPRWRSRVSRCGRWEAPLERGGHVPGGVEVASGGGCLQVDEWMFSGIGRQREETCSKCGPRWLAGDVGDDLVRMGVQGFDDPLSELVPGRRVEPVGVTLDGVK